MAIRRRRILVAEDERTLRSLLATSLETFGFDVDSVSDGKLALEHFTARRYDLVILDIIMPEMDGFDVCRRIRETSDIPIVLLTALDSTADIVAGFEAGADDYITKPFTFEEVRARIAAIFRRVEWLTRRERQKIMTSGQLEVDAEAHTVRLGAEELHVTPIEFELLSYLMAHAGEAVSKQALFTKVWGYDLVGGTNLVEVGVRRLREKIEVDASRPKYIETVRGVGYRFADTVSTRKGRSQ